MIVGSAARRGAGVVHQHRHRPEGGIRLIAQRLDLLEPAHIRRHGPNRLTARGRGVHDKSGRLIECRARQVGETDAHAHRRKPHCRRKPDSARRTGDHGTTTGLQCGVDVHWPALPGNVVGAVGFEPTTR